MSRLSSTMERSIKSKIETATCSIHGEHPKVTFTEKGFSVSCCCENFRQDTISKCEKAVGEALQEEILRSFKKLR